jgi:hypothetical protein
MNTRPDRDQAAEYYFTYIDQVPDGDIRETLRAQLGETLNFLGGLSEHQANHRYARDKWSIREVLGHVNACERLFSFRAFWFARGLEGALPSFDQNVAASHASAGFRSWPSLVDEFRTVRLASLSFFDELPGEAWERRGVASGNPFTVRALAWITAGHVAHHVSILRSKYLAGV